MSIPTGTRLGPYEVIAKIGAGGMGEVYKARDTRLARDVAVKILPPTVREDPERLARFEQEARVTGALNHPNVMAVHDFGSHEGSPYIVSELLDGHTLRDRMIGDKGEPIALPLRKAVDYAIQLARGLAAAHDKGVVHRDLKPENLFITREGRLKILDFGIAKLSSSSSSSASSASSSEQQDSTLAAHTATGAVLGTLGYMSPEQVRGRPADHRSDIFSFGAILYEMMAGARAFRAPSPVETGYAILNHDPAPLSDPAIDRIARRCLEKEPQERYQSARDLAFHLEAISGSATPYPHVPPMNGVSRTSSMSGAAHAGEPRPARAGRGVVAAALLLGTVGGASVGALVASRGRARPAAAPSDVSPPPAPVAAAAPALPSYQQLSFRRGVVRSAHFVPDSNRVIYAAEWDGAEVQSYEVTPGSPDLRPIGPPGMRVADIAPDGELLVISSKKGEGKWGVLGRMPPGGTPREVEVGIVDAAWGPDGKEIAVVRRRSSPPVFTLEYPINNVLVESTDRIMFPRPSRDGKLVAFLPLSGDNEMRGRIAVVDLEKRRRDLTQPYGHRLEGLDWSPDGSEIWFTGSDAGEPLALMAVDLAGQQRVITRGAGSLWLADVSSDGRVLLTHPEFTNAVVGMFAGATQEKDVSWVGTLTATGIAADGKTLVFWSAGTGTGTGTGIYLWDVAGEAQPVRLGDGISGGFSPDGKHVLAIAPGEDRLALMPVGAGETKLLPVGPIASYGHLASPTYTPDGKRVLFCAAERGLPMRLWIQEVAGGPPRPVGHAAPCYSTVNDGTWLATADEKEMPILLALDGSGKTKPIRGAQVKEFVFWMSSDGKSMLLRRKPDGSDNFRVEAFKLDATTGKRTKWGEIAPLFRPGFAGYRAFAIDASGKYYAYTYERILEVLYLASGLR